MLDQRAELVPAEEDAALSFSTNPEDWGHLTGLSAANKLELVLEFGLTSVDYTDCKNALLAGLEIIIDAEQLDPPSELNIAKSLTALCLQSCRTISMAGTRLKGPHSVKHALVAAEELCDRLLEFEQTDLNFQACCLIAVIERQIIRTSEMRPESALMFKLACLELTPTLSELSSGLSTSETAVLKSLKSASTPVAIDSLAKVDLSKLPDNSKEFIQDLAAIIILESSTAEHSHLISHPKNRRAALALLADSGTSNELSKAVKEPATQLLQSELPAHYSSHLANLAFRAEVNPASTSQFVQIHSWSPLVIAMSSSEASLEAGLIALKHMSAELFRNVDFNNTTNANQLNKECSLATLNLLERCLAKEPTIFLPQDIKIINEIVTASANLLEFLLEKSKHSDDLTDFRLAILGQLVAIEEKLFTPAHSAGISVG